MHMPKTLLLAAALAAFLASEPSMAERIWPSLPDSYRSGGARIELANNYGDRQTHEDQGESGGNNKAADSNPYQDRRGQIGILSVFNRSQPSRGGDDGHVSGGSSNDSLSGGDCCSSDQLDD